MQTLEKMVRDLRLIVTFVRGLQSDSKLVLVAMPLKGIRQYQTAIKTPADEQILRLFAESSSI